MSDDEQRGYYYELDGDDEDDGDYDWDDAHPGLGSI